MYRSIETAATVIIVLGLVISAMGVEKMWPDFWNNRLLFNDPKIPLHTLRHEDGYFLPNTITENLTLTPEQNPIIITGTTVIADGITVTTQPGVRFVFNEHAGITIKGSLILTDAVLTSNEVNPLNTVWNGLVVTESGRLTITNSQMRFAVTGITCASEAVASITNTSIEVASIGVFSRSKACQIADDVIFRNVKTDTASTL